MSLINEIIKYGKLVEKYGLIASHSGNISVRKDDKILITATGTMLGNLKEEDIVETSLFAVDENLKFASMESVVHKEIYKNSDAKAIIHAHPVYSISLSMVLDQFVPIDSEGKYILDYVPVLKAKQTVASKEVAEKIHVFFKKHKVVIVKSHGSFAVADSLEKAFYFTSVLENSAKIYYLTKSWISKVF